MSYNRQRMIDLILNESKKIEERCDGYRQEVLNVIVDILNAEREHKSQRTQIQQKVNEMCHSTGDFLARQRGDTDNPTTEAAK